MKNPLLLALLFIMWGSAHAQLSLPLGAMVYADSALREYGQIPDSLIADEAPKVKDQGEFSSEFVESKAGQLFRDALGYATVKFWVLVDSSGKCATHCLTFSLWGPTYNPLEPDSTIKIPFAPLVDSALSKNLPKLSYLPAKKNGQAVACWTKYKLKVKWIE